MLENVFTVLRHTVGLYCIFLLVWIPIPVMVAIDGKHRVDHVIYSSLHVVVSMNSLIIVIYLILINNEVKDYRRQKIRLWRYR